MTKRQELSQQIDHLNTTNEVVIYSKTYCPYSQATKELFQSNFPSAQVKVIELDRDPNGAMIQQLLLAKNGVRTVPNVYVRNQHIGGNDKVQHAYRKGSLAQMLAHRDRDQTTTMRTTDHHRSRPPSQ
jgi:glutaredoxin 3